MAHLSFTGRAQVSTFALVILMGQMRVHANDGWFGQRVITREGTVLKVGSAIVKGMNAPEQSVIASRPAQTDLRVYRVDRVNGQWLWQRNATDKAFADYTTAIALNPSEPFVYYNRGLVWNEKGDVAKALADFGNAIRLKPNFTEAYVGRGDIWTAKKTYDKALADYGEAIRLDPNSALAYIGRADVWIGMQAHDKALADYNEAVRRNPAFAFAYSMRAMFLQSRHDYGNALADYTKAAELSPNQPFAHHCRAWLLATCRDAKWRDGREAVKSAKRGCELTNWKAPHELTTLAAAYAEAGDFDAAVKWQQTAIEHLPKDAEAQRRAFTSVLELFRVRRPVRDVLDKPQIISRPVRLEMAIPSSLPGLWFGLG